jgi:hypothetical protein
MWTCRTARLHGPKKKLNLGGAEGGKTRQHSDRLLGLKDHVFGGQASILAVLESSGFGRLWQADDWWSGRSMGRVVRRWKGAEGPDLRHRPRSSITGPHDMTTHRGKARHASRNMTNYVAIIDVQVTAAEYEYCTYHSHDSYYPTPTTHSVITQ